MMTLLIPRPQAPGKDMDMFLRLMVDELKQLWNQGVETQDAVDNTIFNMHVALIWIVNNFPAQSSLYGWSGQGYKACPTCNEDTPSMQVISKIAYMGHTQFLPMSHVWRNSRKFNGKRERRPLP